jgi:hypothetical protein
MPSPTQSQSRSRRTTLTAELLEDRCTPATLVVNTIDDPGTLGDAFLTLREAIAVVNSQSTTGLSANEQGQISGTLGDNDTIGFDPTVFGTPRTITLGGTQLPVDVDVTISGPGASLLTIDANGQSRIFQVPAGRTASISGLTLTGANSGSFGGAINNGGKLTLSSSILSNNEADEGGGI